jgi:prolyl oligopeptidase
LKAQAEEFLDASDQGEDGTGGVRADAWSRDGRYYAYAVSRGGSDWVEIKIRDAETMEDLPEQLNWAR